MPIEYDPAEMPGAQQVLNGTRALLQYLHASKITVAPSLVLVALAQHSRGMSEDQLLEELGMSEAELGAVRQSLHRHRLIATHRGDFHTLTEEGRIRVTALIQAVLMTAE
ncbi:hypothetical protein [Verrucomicrobium spinosum]|uniref:hypothetical protein n=1 Tax=Verrucomicrobium spinosum TaxID=2736 RepID=UPI00017463F0|nr:hypothetical protein [Verrucomicrobium spinosum]